MPGRSGVRAAAATRTPILRLPAYSPWATHSMRMAP